MELDAATHGLVDDARDLRDKAFFAPVQSRYKIYIIDEAHQLGPGAANALLKVVEEPPPHVLFIFATTEPDKLISTIRSRTHHYPFRLVPPIVLAEHLEGVCTQEGVAVAKGVIPLVVRASGGSVRDALSVLGQLLAGAGSNGVTYDVATALLGFTDGALLDEAIDALAARDGASLFNTVNRLVESGHDPRRFTQDLLERLRDLIIVGASKDNAGHILREHPADQLDRMSSQAKLIGAATLIRSADIAADGLTEMRGATAPRLILELICARILLPGNDDQALLARIERVEKLSQVRELPRLEEPPAPPRETKAQEITPAVKEDNEKPAQKLLPKKEALTIRTTPPPSGPVDIAALRKFWPEVIENVKKQRRLTWSLLSASAQVLSVDEQAITIGIINSGARDSFIRSESDVILRRAFAEVVGLDLKVECIVDPSVSAASTTPERTGEDPTDKAGLSGAALLAKELGAQVIRQFTNDV